MNGRTTCTSNCRRRTSYGSSLNSGYAIAYGARLARVILCSFLLSTRAISYCYQGTGSFGGTVIRGSRSTAARSSHASAATAGYSAATYTARAADPACGSRSSWLAGRSYGPTRTPFRAPNKPVAIRSYEGSRGTRASARKGASTDRY